MPRRRKPSPQEEKTRAALDQIAASLTELGQVHGAAICITPGLNDDCNGVRIWTVGPDAWCRGLLEAAYEAYDGEDEETGEDES